MSIRQHPLYQSQILPHLRVNYYDRDGSAKDPRFRLEAAPTMPAAMFDERCACVTCGALMEPLRMRGGKIATGYLTVTCPISVSVGCARTISKSSPEYKAIRDDIEARK